MFSERGLLKVTDFGIARFIGGTGGLTGSGLVLGTPQYMSPEQIMGAELTPATDLYALGILLYEMLAQRGPFRRA